tara:strand:+ start:284 stop:586 length:303 start_codon:yes stop_codon:yes gene_type:complete
MAKPVATPSNIPFLSENDHERGLRSKRKNQYVGTNKIHALHKMKNTWDASSPSITRRVINTERVGAKPTSDIATNDLLGDSTHRFLNATEISFVAAIIAS